MPVFSCSSIQSRVTLIILGLCLTFIFADVFMLQREYSLQSSLNAEMSHNASINQITRNAINKAYLAQNMSLKAFQVARNPDGLGLLDIYHETISSTAVDFEMYMTVLKYGSTSDAFKNLEEGRLYERWRNSDFTGDFIIDKAPIELSNYAAEAALYFSVYRNYAEKAIKHIRRATEMEAGSASFDELYSQAEKAISSAAEYSRLSTGALEDLILVNDELNRKIQQSLVVQAEDKVLTSAMLYLSATVLSIIFGLLLARRLIVNPVVSLSQWIQSIDMANLSVPPVTTDTDELNQLVDSFTDMAKRLKQTTVSKSFVDDIINSMNEYLVLFDTDGNIVRASDKFCEALEYRCRKADGLSIREVLDDEELVDEIISASMRGEDISQRETVLTGGNGVELPVLLSSSLVAAEGADDYLIVCVATDYTELLESRKLLESHRDMLDETVTEKTKALSNALTLAEQAAVNAEHANQTKSMFLANMSHELRTPMHAIMNYTEMGIEDIDDDEFGSVQTYLGNIRTSSDRMLNLLNDLLDLSKLEADRMNIELHRNNLVSLIRQCIDELNSLCRDKQLTIRFDTDVDEAIARFDRDKLHQVIINLLSNAIKFSPESSIISIELEPVVVRVPDLPDQDGYSIKVIDEGVGIPEDELKSVFDKFFQSSKTRTQAGGTGLGLAVSQLIVEAHNGRIWADNNLNAGTCFTLHLPAMLEDSANSESTSRAA